MSLMIDIFVAVLLISAIGYGIILNRRIVSLRRDQAKLERLASSFQQATKRAEVSVGKLKKAVQGSSEILNEGIDTAKRIREDLNFLVDRGEKLGDRLESSVRTVESSTPMRENAEKQRAGLNKQDLVGDFQSSETIKKISPDNKENAASFGAELLGKKIVKSEVEREFIKALRAVR